MKILMFVNPYLNLCQPVVEELRTQGHDVSVIDDFFEYHDPKDMARCGRLNTKKIESWNNSVSSYWRKHEDVIARDYDLFISFNGWSINETAFELIDKYSPKCVKVQYCWDSFKFVDMRITEEFFDKLYTFDIVDAQNPGWRLLPSFFVHKETGDKESGEEYDLFMIGANHDNRYSFVRKVLRGLKPHNLNNYIKIYVPPITNLTLNFLIDCAKSFLNFNHVHEMMFKYGFENKHLMTNAQISLDKYTEIMRKSRFILDDNRPGQAGLSPRFIRALAHRKKIVTTNKWACRYSFVDEGSVLIVDKGKPIVDIDFLKARDGYPLPPDFETLELSSWVKILTGEIECPSFARELPSDPIG